jgi:hypothetical protein
MQQRWQRWRSVFVSWSSTSNICSTVYPTLPSNNSQRDIRVGGDGDDEDEDWATEVVLRYLALAHGTWPLMAMAVNKDKE